MPNGDSQSVEQILAAAKAELNKANSIPVPKAPAEAPKPAAKAAPAKKATTTDELSERQKNIDAYNKANPDSPMPKMHKGGVVKHDGPHNLQKGEVVISKDQVKNMKLDALKNAGEEDAAEKKDKAPKKESKKESHRPAGRARHARTIVEHHDNGSHTVEHIAHPNEDGTPGQNVKYSVESMDGVHDGLEEHVGEPNPGEAEAEAGQSGIEE